MQLKLYFVYSSRIAKKNRVAIPDEIAAAVLFRANRTCSVCREKKPVQIHHIDENPEHYTEENLAVLCFDCHRDTQIRGGFDRKLDSAQIRRYRKDWLTRVANKREQEHGPLNLPPQHKMHQTRVVQYIQIKESSDEHLYSIDAEYPQFSSDEPQIEEELNSRVSAFITAVADDFRVAAIAQMPEKLRMKEARSATSWDSLSIVHKISLLTPSYLSIEFAFQTYGAGAAHPNSVTRTLNFQFAPFKQIELDDLFRPSTNYLQALSEYCIGELHKLQPPRWWNPSERADHMKLRLDEWITKGAAPNSANYKSFVFVNEGVKIFFDPYQVACYAEGRYEVFVPFQYLKPFLTEQIYGTRP
jgi:hypothetical protein